MSGDCRAVPCRSSHAGRADEPGHGPHPASRRTRKRAMSTTTALDPRLSRSAPPRSVRLGRHTASGTTEPREILSVPGAEGSTLVIARLANGLTGRGLAQSAITLAKPPHLTS
jgi:hypothetical protein